MTDPATSNSDRRGAMSDADICKYVKSLVKDAEEYRNTASVDRTRAMEYYDGTMTDTPAEETRSRVVSRDVRAAVKKVIPSILRIILGGDKVVEYLPMQAGDVAMAEQATDYINYLAFPESDGADAVHDAVFDAMVTRNGVLKWWFDQRSDIEVSRHSGLDDPTFNNLVVGDDVEVLEHTAHEQFMDVIAPDGTTVSVPSGAAIHDVVIRRTITKRRVRVSAIPLDHFLIHPDAITLEESPIIGESCRMRRSDLVAMGYDRARVWAMPTAGSNSSNEIDSEEDSRRRDVTVHGEADDKANQEIDYYDLLVRIDADDDGFAELRRMVFAGGIGAEHLLSNEYWDEINYCDIVCERRPHQWEGNSIADDVAEIQRIKTVLLRQTLDNLYWQNNMQPIVQEGMIVNPEAVTNPTFGLPIRVNAGTDVNAAIRYNTVPFIAEKSFSMLGYLDNEAQDRTGISEASAGMAPDALQNMTAKASAMVEQQGIGQTEQMVRTIANGLKPMFRGLLKLVIQHQDQKRTVRMRGKWVEYDPKTWDAGMDVTVNTGLGAGTRERDMMMMGIVTGLQEKIVGAMGLDNPFVKPDQLYNAIAKTVEASGLKSVDQYFTKPDDQAMAQFMQAKAQQPSETQQKIAGEKEIAQLQGAIDLQIKDKEIQKDAAKEAAQRDADLVIKQAELEKETTASMHEVTLKAQSEAAKLEIEREKIISHERIEAAKLEAQIMLERERMDRAEVQAERERQTRAQEAQAAERQPEMVQ